MSARYSLLMLFFITAACSVQGDLGIRRDKIWCEGETPAKYRKAKEIERSSFRPVISDFQSEAQSLLSKNRFKKISSTEAMHFSGNDSMFSIREGANYYLIRAATLHWDYQKMRDIDYSILFDSENKAVIFSSFGMYQPGSIPHNFAALISLPENLLDSDSVCFGAS